MYTAEGDKVYVEQDDSKELFLTVHPTGTGGTVTTADQARIIAEMLNNICC